MSKLAWYVVIAAVAAALIPLTPKIVRFRIWLLRKLHWGKLAEWHERSYTGIVVTLRLVLAAVVVVLLVLAFGG